MQGIVSMTSYPIGIARYFSSSLYILNLGGPCWVFLFFLDFEKDRALGVGGGRRQFTAFPVSLSCDYCWCFVVERCWLDQSQPYWFP